MDAATIARRVVCHIPAMVAYWDAAERCVFANEAYREWFGRARDEMPGLTLRELLGPLYEKNRPYIRAALGGAKQVFERQIVLPNGEIRETIATYTPDIVDGMVRGFSAQVADITGIKRREVALNQTIQEVILVLEKTKRSFQSKELGALRQRLLQLSRPPAGTAVTSPA